MWKEAIVLFGVLSLSVDLQAQSLLDSIAPAPVAQTRAQAWAAQPRTFFKSTRIINLQSTETPDKGELDFRVVHRFGDMATPHTGYHTLFGLDRADDIFLGLDYGLCKGTQLSIGRAKGSGAWQELWQGGIKQQIPGVSHIGSMPLRLALYGSATLSTMRLDPLAGGELKNAPFGHRLAYVSQVIAAASPAPWLVVQLSPTYLHRNYTATKEATGLFSVGVATRLKISRSFSLLAEYIPTLAATAGAGSLKPPVFYGSQTKGYYVPLHFGLELETGGHVFCINLTNTQGITEQDFLAYNPNNWGKGAFRMGFTIARTFNVGKR